MGSATNPMWEDMEKRLLGVNDDDQLDQLIRLIRRYGRVRDRRPVNGDYQEWKTVWEAQWASSIGPVEREAEEKYPRHPDDRPDPICSENSDWSEDEKI